ncbi:glycosyltransferase [Negadavirga shengliensis]|uniref:Glycosyltransferase n=1 Tax=Negadavirga shengliensis TaxID=1389218 RepID=A0ABV9T2C1_9BACT
MKKLLIATKAQYGYHVDPYKYGYYIKESYEITHISWDFGLPRAPEKGLKTIYISRKGNKILRYYRFLKEIHREIRSQSYDIVFMVYFAGCSLIKLLNPGKTFNIDIRTATDTKNETVNFLKDALLKWECARFEHLTILSHGLAERLGMRNYHYLPLGGEPFCKKDKNFEKAHFLYVGTLENRNLITFVRGFHRFLKVDEASNASTLLTIIGDGPGNELAEIRDYIHQHALEKHIVTTGYIQNDNLSAHFDLANIGVSFVPMTPYYDHQPPTKTYEYLLSGMPVLATATTENRKIIDESCGVLMRDDEEAVAAGLEEIVKKLGHFDSRTIRMRCRESAWSNISQKNLKPYLDSLSSPADFSFHSQLQA